MCRCIKCIIFQNVRKLPTDYFHFVHVSVRNSPQYQYATVHSISMQQSTVRSISMQQSAVSVRNSPQYQYVTVPSISTQQSTAENDTTILQLSQIYYLQINLSLYQMVAKEK